MALGATRASLRRRQTLPRESTDGWGEPESHDAVSFLTQTSPVTSHHQETSFLGEGTLPLHAAASPVRRPCLHQRGVLAYSAAGLLLT